VAHAYNPNYLGSRDQEDYGSKPAHTNNFQDSISKITREEWTGGVAQVVECLLCKCKVLNSNPSPTKKKERKKERKEKKMLLWEV
jgi:hypothetical protein